MAYVTPSSGQVLVPSAQYVSQGTNFTPPVNVYPPDYRISQNKPAPAPGNYAASCIYISAILLGVLLVCDGALAMAASAIAFRYFASYSEIGTGLWCGAMFVSAGAVAIAAGHHRTFCLICATIASSAFAVIFGITLTSISIFLLYEDLNTYDTERTRYARLSEGIMIGAGLAAIVFGFTLSVVYCVALCRIPSPQVVPIQYIPDAPQSMGTTATPNQQQVGLNLMAYVTPSSGQVLVPSAQYVSPGTNFTSPINAYSPDYRVSQDNPALAPGKYAASCIYNSAICLGVLLVWDGALAMAGSAIAFRYYASYSEIGTGLWCGAMFVSTGAAAIAAGHQRTYCLICATTVTSVLAVIFGITLTILSAIGFYDNYLYFMGDLPLVAHVLMIGAGSAAIILGVSLFIVCCVALCRISSPQVVPVQYIPDTPQSMGTTSAPTQQVGVLSVPVRRVELPTTQNHPSASISVFHGPNHHRSDRHRDALALI